MHIMHKSIFTYAWMRQFTLVHTFLYTQHTEHAQVYGSAHTHPSAHAQSYAHSPFRHMYTQTH